MHGGDPSSTTISNTSLDQPASAHGEFLTVPERLIVAPMAGRFEPAPLPGDVVAPGQAVGCVVRSGDRVEVRSPVAGRFMGHLADSGERVRDGQPLAWVRLAS